MTKTQILPIVLLTILIGGGLTITNANATDGVDPQTSLIQRLVTKFGLKESDVKQVFDEVRTERQSQMRNRFEERLTQAVTDQKITEAQKKLILDKRDELANQRQAAGEALGGLTPEERRAAMDDKRAEIKAWAESNNIDVSYLTFGRGGDWPDGPGVRDR